MQDDGWLTLANEADHCRSLESACRAIYDLNRDEGHPYRRPWGLDGELFETALAGIGIKCSDIALAALSHFHIDHTGGLPLLAAAGVPVVVQKRELDFAMSEAGIAQAYFRSDYDDRHCARAVAAQSESARGSLNAFRNGNWR